MDDWQAPSADRCSLRGHRQGFLSSKKFTESDCMGPWTENLSFQKSSTCRTFSPLAQQTHLSPHLIFISFIPEKNNISFKIPVESKKNMVRMRWGVFYWRHWITKKPSYSFQRELTVKLNLHWGVHLKQFHITETPVVFFIERECVTNLIKTHQFGWAVTAVCSVVVLSSSDGGELVFSRGWHWNILCKLATETLMNN